MGYTDYRIQVIRDHLDRSVVITGLMGAGKTRLGRALARTLDMVFVDTDEEIEKAAGCSIKEIFETMGEQVFRDGERRVIRRVVNEHGNNAVISTGGGAVMTPETFDLIRKTCLMVWIRADLDTMLARTSRNDNRPMLKGGDPKEILQSLMEQRYPVYARSDIVVDSDERPVEEILNTTLDQIYDLLTYDR